MAETVPIICDTTKPATATVSSTSVLETAHQTLRDIHEEQIHDLDTALKKLGEERRKYVEMRIKLGHYSNKYIELYFKHVSFLMQR